MKLVRTSKFLAFACSFLILFNLIFINKLFASDFCNNEIFQKIYEQKINNNNIGKFEYHEDRNDIGIFYDFAYDSKAKIMEIKRNEKKFPIVRFSLFEKEKIVSGKTIIKSFNDIDLSKLYDDQIIELHKSSGKVNLKLYNGQNVLLISKPYKLNDFKLSHFDIKSIHSIDTSKGILELSFEANFTNSRPDFLEILKNYIIEDTGRHEICSEFKNKLPWPIVSIGFDEFKYDADVREGLKNKEKLVTSVFDLIYDRKNNEIRTFRIEKGVAFFRQSFNFRNFPFDTQKLIITIKVGEGSFMYENQQNRKVEGSVTLVTPEIGAYLNLIKFIDPKQNKLKAWNIVEEGIAIKSREIFDDNYYDRYEKKIIRKSENVIDIEIKLERYFQHYLLKIMLPVFLILCVAWYVLWIPTRKYETRLNTSIIALLALIAYNFVFQDDIPKLEYLTDLDWYILLSYVFCCIPVFISIGSSKLGTKNQKAIIKINKYIRKWGILAYILITLTIFKFT